SKEPSRKIPLKIEFAERGCEYAITFAFEKIKAEKIFPKSKYPASQNFEAAKAKISESLQKLGGTNFCAENVLFSAKSAPFLRASEINELRRALAENLEKELVNGHLKRRAVPRALPKYSGIEKEFFNADYRANALNAKARQFYKKCGIDILEPALESGAADFCGRELMRTKHCILRELGMCKRRGLLPKGLKEPLFLKSDEAFLRLQFECAGGCGMKIFLGEKA
ncbi:MAG: DUF3656 domain-containing protein, partial [Opitutales bacterium]|nr:DUF3656 domain-containing protein [Opitutales bacterium]